MKASFMLLITWHGILQLENEHNKYTSLCLKGQKRLDQVIWHISSTYKRKHCELSNRALNFVSRIAIVITCIKESQSNIIVPVVLLNKISRLEGEINEI